MAINSALTSLPARLLVGFTSGMAVATLAAAQVPRTRSWTPCRPGASTPSARTSTVRPKALRCIASATRTIQDPDRGICRQRQRHRDRPQHPDGLAKSGRSPAPAVYRSASLLRRPGAGWPNRLARALHQRAVFADRLPRRAIGVRTRHGQALHRHLGVRLRIPVAPHGVYGPVLEQHALRQRAHHQRSTAPTRVRSASTSPTATSKPTVPGWTTSQARELPRAACQPRPEPLRVARHRATSCAA